MDAYEATRIVYSRIQTLDPNNAAKIMGLLLLQDHGDKEMIRLALGPETLIQSLIIKARRELAYEDIGLCGPHRQEAAGFGWKPCLYFARGFCKNGSGCKFLHDHEKLDANFVYSPPTGMMSVSPSSSNCINFFLQQQQQLQQQNESQRVAALMLREDETQKFMGRSRIDYAAMVNPSSRQIYLTFPADSTFREEDVSNYFSIYGPVQDARIPYQQKRMFGFVTFVYPETVKLILAKGNPHFVCDARVLVKPYKEKGKVSDKFRKHQCEDFKEQFDLQQLGSRIMYNNANTYQESQEMLLRRKLEQQQAAELQQAIDYQRSRFMDLSLLDLKNRSPTTTISSPTTISTTLSNDRSFDESPTEEKSPSLGSTGGEQGLIAVNVADTEKSNEDGDFQDSVEHNLPDSPFASPTKASSLSADDPFASYSVNDSELVGAGSAHSNTNGNASAHLVASTLFPSTSTLDMASFKSCFLQMPRFSSGHGAVGL